MTKREKTSGRKQGTQNKINKEIQQSFKELIENNIDKLQIDIEALEPKDRLNVLCKLMPYVFPRVESVHTKEGEPFTMDFWQ